MATIEVVKMRDGNLRGYGQEHDRAYKRFKGWLKRLEPGEFFTFSWRQPRNPAFHRKFFALLNHGFEHWEPEQGRKRLTYRGRAIEKNFEAFRENIIILAGFYEQSFDLQGRMQLRAKSISFDKMGEEEFERLYEAVLKVLLEHVLTNYKRGDLERVVAELERFGS
jgi:uncharacterized protein DUF1367